jgi:hypothetical protein
MSESHGTEQLDRSPFTRHGRSFVQARSLVRVFYCFILFFANSSYLEMLDITPDILESPFWLTSWIRLVPLSLAGQLLGVGFVLSALAAALAPQYRSCRLLVCFFYLQYICTLAFHLNGRGNPTSLMSFWVSVIFVLLPYSQAAIEKTPRIERQTYLFVFWGAQCLVLFFYSLAGLGKILDSARLAYSGDPSYFSPSGLATLICNWLDASRIESPLAEMILDRPWLGLPLSTCTLYFELFAVLVAFRPALHELWGSFLILFHVSVTILLGVSFSENVMLVGILFLCSPFKPQPSEGWPALSYLPGAGIVRRVLRAIRPVG